MKTHVKMTRMLVLGGCLLLTTAAAPADDFRPLTRSEPVVRMVLQEAGNEPFAGMVAVAGVALDRAGDDRWPDSVHHVVYQPRQFTDMAIPLRNYSREQITRARLAVATAEVGHRPCGRVLWYHTKSVRPGWSRGAVSACIVGAHIFYTSLRDSPEFRVAKISPIKPALKIAAKPAPGPADFLDDSLTYDVFANAIQDQPEPVMVATAPKRETQYASIAAEDAEQDWADGWPVEVPELFSALVSALSDRSNWSHDYPGEERTLHR